MLPLLLRLWLLSVILQRERKNNTARKGTMFSGERSPLVQTLQAVSRTVKRNQRRRKKRQRGFDFSFRQSLKAAADC